MKLGVERWRTKALNREEWTSIIKEVKGQTERAIALQEEEEFHTHEKKFSVDKKNQLDVTFCILYFSSNSCSTCFGQPCAHHQELTTA